MGRKIIAGPGALTDDVSETRICEATDTLFALCLESARRVCPERATMPDEGFTGSAGSAAIQGLLPKMIEGGLKRDEVAFVLGTAFGYMFGALPVETTVTNFVRGLDAGVEARSA